MKSHKFDSGLATSGARTNCAAKCNGRQPLSVPLVSTIDWSCSGNWKENERKLLWFILIRLIPIWRCPIHLEAHLRNASLKSRTYGTSMNLPGTLEQCPNGDVYPQSGSAFFPTQSSCVRCKCPSWTWRKAGCIWHNLPKKKGNEKWKMKRILEIVYDKMHW